MTKTGVDLVDQLCQRKDVSRSTRRWPIVLFYDILNISAINAFCIYKNHHQSIRRVEFLQKLSWELSNSKPQVEKRSQIATFPQELRRRAKCLVGVSDTSEPPAAEPVGQRSTCCMCGRSRDKSAYKEVVHQMIVN